jgi:NitT/TauT family transport system ATP-binding protein
MDISTSSDIPTQRKAAALIELSDVSKVFGTSKFLALKNINLKVYPDEILTLLGPSGCGKSTLLRIIAALEHPSSGHVLLMGKQISGIPGPECFVIFQDLDQLFPWRTLQGNVMYALRRRGIAKEQLTERASELLALVGLEAFAGSYPHQLSGGMKQRGAIARALALNPLVLLMDEPFGSLDAITRRRLGNSLLDIWSRVPKTTVFVTHSIQEAVLLGDRVVVMGSRPGSIIEIVTLPSRPRDFASPQIVGLIQRLEKLLEVN